MIIDRQLLLIFGKTLRYTGPQGCTLHCTLHTARKSKKLSPLEDDRKKHYKKVTNSANGEIGREISKHSNNSRFKTKNIQKRIKSSS